jgi:hypothetical protein
MEPRQSDASLRGCAIVKAPCGNQYETIRAAPNEKGASGHDFTALYAALEHDAITALAHRYWQERGHPEGSAAEDWFRAEQDFYNRVEFGYFPDYFEVGVSLRLPH